MQKLSVRELEEKDIVPLARYWTEAETGYLQSMGADPSLIPDLAEWVIRLKEQMLLPYSEKKSYCVIWEVNGEAKGHSNVNNICYGSHANLHLHIWDKNLRKRGIGSQLLPHSLALFFKNLELSKIICEPSANNPAPNHTLAKLGFTKAGSRICVPGMICFEQEVNTWELSAQAFRTLEI